MTIMNPQQRRRRVVVGVDTHKHIHVAVALDELGAVIDTGPSELIVSVTGSYWNGRPASATSSRSRSKGPGHTAQGSPPVVRRADIGVVEVMRADRRQRRLNGKSDTLDAENAARAAMSGTATAVPKTTTVSSKCSARSRSPKTRLSRPEPRR